MDYRAQIVGIADLCGYSNNVNYLKHTFKSDFLIVLHLLLIQENQMKTKPQIQYDINRLLSFIQQNRQSLLQSSLPQYNREILDIKDNFYTFVNDLSSEFTEQELYTIETDLSFYYQTLKEIIDFIDIRIQIYNPPYVIEPPHQYHPPVENIINTCLINQEDIDQYAIYIQRRIDGIKNEIEKKQKLQLQKIVEIYQLFKGLADNENQEIMAMDERLYYRQTQRYRGEIKNIINVLDGV